MRTAASPACKNAVQQKPRPRRALAPASAPCKGRPVTLEWSDFKVLLALHRASSVAGAARLLQVDNSTVSRRLAALEEAVEAKLLIRGGREFTWTTAGRTLIEAGEAMEAAATAALRVVRTAKVELSGTDPNGPGGTAVPTRPNSSGATRRFSVQVRRAVPPETSPGRAPGRHARAGRRPPRRRPYRPSSPRGRGRTCTRRAAAGAGAIRSA